VTTHVIVRISSTIVHESHLASYLGHLENGVIPKYEAAEGMVRVYLLQRRLVAYVEILEVSLWRSQEVVQRFMENELLTEDVRREYGVVEVEPRTFEVVLFRKGRAPGNEESRKT